MVQVIPIYNSRQAQTALEAWEACRQRIDSLQAALESAQSELRAALRAEAHRDSSDGSSPRQQQQEATGFWGQQRRQWEVGRRQGLAARVARLQGNLDKQLSKLEAARVKWEEARRAAEELPPLPAFLVTFYSQQSAFFASRANANPEQMRMMTVRPGVGWMGWCCGCVGC